MKNDGMASQKDYLDLLKEEMKYDINFIVHEFVDTRKARNFVESNPSDFFACYKSTPWLIEVKSSIDLARFPLWMELYVCNPPCNMGFMVFCTI